MLKKAVRDPQKTRQKVLKHALAEFSAKGFDGARVDSIARRCKLSKNMLYHYFGSKDGLFASVLEQMYAGIRERQNELSLLTLEPISAMRELIAYTFAAFLEHPEIVTLLNTENLMKGRHVGASKIILSSYEPLIDTIRNVAERGGATGVFRQDIDPVQLYISLAALSYHYISNRYTLGAIFGRDLLSPDQTQVRLQHIVDLVMAYCTTGAAVTQPDVAAEPPARSLPSRPQAKRVAGAESTGVTRAPRRARAKTLPDHLP